jgi:hypothetical protein
MSWQASVIGVGPQFIPDGCSGVGGWFCRPLMAPVAVSVKSRGPLTIAAAAGFASGTLMTSIRHRAGLAPVAGSSTQPSSVEAGRTPAVPET